METAVWLPMTCAQTIVRASHCVGLTLPGIMELPGSFSGRESSPRPQRGPLARKRMSLATFMSEHATTLRAPLISTIASCAAIASNLLRAVTNGSPVAAATFSATFSAKPSLVLRPVPTAVPPCASSSTAGSAARTRAAPLATCAAYPPNSWPSVSGTASWVCVRPILTMWSNSSAFLASAALSESSAGATRCAASVAAAMCITLGKVSFELWPRLTWSLG
mmetsp:Transcript_12555/g.52808  ORF Transcript_12555/g.52808 Transcript_12555/m.52808 type:complete len:221 (+) Transcript_12555:424-1086(+)